MVVAVTMEDTLEVVVAVTLEDTLEVVVSTISFNYEIIEGFLTSLTFGFRTSLLDSVRHI